MSVRLLVTDLPEASHLLPDLSVRQEGAKRGVIFYFVLEREFRARKQTNRDVGLSNCCESARDRVGKPRLYQFVAYLCGAGRDRMQAVIKHRLFLLCSLAHQYPPHPCSCPTRHP